MPITSLVKADWNYKMNDNLLSEKLANNIKRNGQIENIIIRELDTGFFEVVNGNHRLDVLKSIGYLDVHCFNLGSISESQAKRIAVETNETRFESDIKLLSETITSILEEFSLDEIEITMPFTEDEINQMLGKIEELEESPIVEEDNFIEPEIDTVKTRVKLGDIIEIGKHRLMCGDSTNQKDIDILMNGNKADMIFTDPPYGVNYSGGIQFKKDGVERNNRKKLENDGDGEIYTKSIPIMAKICNGAIYTWFAGTTALEIYQAIGKVGEIHAVLIWVKNGGYAAMNANYKQKHEPCLYWKPKNKTLNFIGDTTETTIWEINKDGVNKLHPTQKPVALAAKAIGNHKAEIVADIFLGSGSTMVACHQLNRICYGMEISPEYCQVVIDRMIELDAEIDIKINGDEYVKL